MKSKYVMTSSVYLQSPPSRGAWIEILIKYTLFYHTGSRPPRGGRGLKYRCTRHYNR